MYVYFKLIIICILDENNPNKVIVKKLALCVADRPCMELDLSGDVSNLKKQVITFKIKYFFFKKYKRCYILQI